MIDDMGKENVSVTLRISPDDHKAWLAAAEAEQMSLSSWIRRRCNGLQTTAPIAKPTKKAKRS